MLRFKTSVFIVLLITCAILLAGCATQGAQTGTANSSPAGTEPASAESSTTLASAAPTDNQNAPDATPSESPKNATWVIDINDTTEYTDELGIIWKYTLTFHASKPGGTDTTGEYAGDAVLKIEPDFGTVQAAAAREGTQLLSMIFNYHAQCESFSFVVEKYTNEPEDGPLAPLSTADFYAESSATFDSTQEPVEGTIQTSKGPFTAAGGGGGATVNVPFVIEITGASVSVRFANLPQPLEYAFKGTVTGDVLPG
jgi:hypothetical protein